MSDQLDANYKEKGSLKCLDIKAFGFDSHVPCYIETGPDLSYCGLTWHDYKEITKIAWDDW